MKLVVIIICTSLLVLGVAAYCGHQISLSEPFLFGNAALIAAIGVATLCFKNREAAFVPVLMGIALAISFQQWGNGTDRYAQCEQKMMSSSFSRANSGSGYSATAIWLH